jgi:hypothetical protein
MTSGKGKALLFVGIGFELFAMSLAAIYVGPLIDHYFGLNGLGTLGLFFILFIGWVVHFVQLLKKTGLIS